MDNIEDILRALAYDGDEPTDPEPDSPQDSSSEGGGIFGNLDPEMLLKIFTLMETFKTPSDNERFLLALRPMLREENRSKVDTAVKIMKLLALLPVLKDSGIFGKLL